MQHVRRKKSNGCCRKWIFGSLLYIFILCLLIFVLVFVIIPVIFKYSVGIQRYLVFMPWVIPAHVNYSNIDQFGIKGVKNFDVVLQKDYISDGVDNITLGVWQILPFEMLSELVNNEDYNYDSALHNEKYNVLIYLHGNGDDRTGAVDKYLILRKYFHIFAVDYRGYADSTNAELTETNVVTDIIKFYKWLKIRTESKIYVWGHSLGTGIGTHMLANLKKENISSKGLILEAPFTSVTHVMQTNPIIKMFFSWLPWFYTTTIKPIIDNDFNFNSTKYIIDIDCPIMILHAMDDTIIPYTFGRELYNVAINNRNYTYQGNVTYQLFETLGYDHIFIFKAPELPVYIEEFIEDCHNFEKKL